jgi:hypothetical protein
MPLERAFKHLGLFQKDSAQWAKRRGDFSWCLERLM